MNRNIMGGEIMAERTATAAGALLLIAGARGAIGSTLATGAALLESEPQAILPYLTAVERFPVCDPPLQLAVAGWDLADRGIEEALTRHRVVPRRTWHPLMPALERMPVRPFPLAGKLAERVETLTSDIAAFRALHPGLPAVMVNLLPAAPLADLAHLPDIPSLLAAPEALALPDLAYALAALRCGVPLVNFTPNEVELPALLREAEARAVPICGRDGKTGQTFLKVVLASALRARQLQVEGWYSLNILGNADGRNLMDPDCAAGKLANKTDLLDNLLGYSVGGGPESGAHKVHIDYYPPRGDAKEAWDVIDFRGFFGLPMSLRLNLQGRDSILAAPMAIDLALWMIALQRAGFRGAVPSLAFYFKRPVGKNPPLRFEEQTAALEALQRQVRAPQTSRGEENA